METQKMDSKLIDQNIQLTMDLLNKLAVPSNLDDLDLEMALTAPYVMLRVFLAEKIVISMKEDLKISVTGQNMEQGNKLIQVTEDFIKEFVEKNTVSKLETIKKSEVTIKRIKEKYGRGEKDGESI